MSHLPEHYTKHFTLVFAGDLRDHAGNPFLIDTPYGRPVGVSLGDVCIERDLLEEQLRDAGLEPVQP